MFTKRIIPCLDVNNGRVVKGVNFVNLRDAGDPVAVAAAGTAVLVSLLRAPTKSTTFGSPGPTPRSPH